jgi:serine/threonine protein kinase
MSKDLGANTTLSHYRIVSKIGAGGMGEVYLAQDTKLDRKVALKILPADLADLTRKTSEKNYVSPYSIAVIYAGLEDKDKTFLWLERAYSERSYDLPIYLTTDARLDWLHSDPRFKDLVRRIGLPELN